MMAVRKSLSKKQRFEVFKRDGFTCQYCGSRPPSIVLVVDHINPVKEGGDNDDMNLITSCEQCNQGKAAKPLDVVINKPDTDTKWLELQQEIAELRRYQLAREERDLLYAEIISRMQELWWEVVDNKTAPADGEFKKWLAWARPDQIEDAIRVTGGNAWKLYVYIEKVKYFCAVLRNMVHEHGDDNA